MRKLLKGLSVLQIVIGILCAVVGIVDLVIGDLMSSLAKLPAEQQALTAMRVSAVLGLISAVFNFNCGWCGLKGEKGNKKSLSRAVKLGWLGLVAAVVSGVLTVFGDMNFERVCTVVASSVVPILFLVSVKSISMRMGSKRSGGTENV